MGPNFCLLTAKTSNARYARSSSGTKFAQFYIDGFWQEPLEFFAYTGFRDTEQMTVDFTGTSLPFDISLPLSLL